MARLEISPRGLPRPKVQEPERNSGQMPTGIEVREEPLGTVKAQHVYQLRCECGRAWFELELPTLVQCPACGKVSAVSL